MYPALKCGNSYALVLVERMDFSEMHSFCCLVSLLLPARFSHFVKIWCVIYASCEMRSIIHSLNKDSKIGRPFMSPFGELYHVVLFS